MEVKTVSISKEVIVFDDDEMEILKNSYIANTSAVFAGLKQSGKREFDVFRNTTKYNTIDEKTDYVKMGGIMFELSEIESNLKGA